MIRAKTVHPRNRPRRPSQWIPRNALMPYPGHENMYTLGVYGKKLDSHIMRSQTWVQIYHPVHFTNNTSILNRVRDLRGKSPISTKIESRRENVYNKTRQFRVHL